jgi:hypothetical protein
MLIEPSNGLEKGLLLGEPLQLVAGVTADGEPVNDATEQVDLVGLLGLDENLLRLMPLFRREDVVCFGGADA